MSKVSINESTLTAIGDAIREKTGKSDLIAPGDMPTEIEGIRGVSEPLIITGNAGYACSGSVAAKYIELFGDLVSTENLINMEYMFHRYPGKTVPFEINGKIDYTGGMAIARMFNASEIEEPPKMNNIRVASWNYAFAQSKVRRIPGDFMDTWDFSYVMSSNGQGQNMSGLFASAHYLRTIEEPALSNFGFTGYNYYQYPYTSLCASCYVLDELKGVCVYDFTQTYSTLGSMVADCYRLKNLTFQVNEDGTPKVATWAGQTLSLNTRIGYVYNIGSLSSYGISDDKEVSDDATYQALKNDPDWWTKDRAYSRYNHDSAVATINSLPDTSAYVATKPNYPNTIKFEGAVGSKTDGGAINTLTEEEIAVATAKGWTVSFS